ncbi:mitochondrial transcription rescue factor 1 [Pelodytes ibericus]
MTGVRLPLSAFRNLQVCARYFQKQNVLKHGTCRIQYRLLSNGIPLTGGFQQTNPHAATILQPGNLYVNVIRLKSKKSQKNSSKGASQEEEEEDDKDPEDISDYEDDPVEDPNIPKDYKDLEKAVQSFRYDVILSAGLDVSRNKVEEAFYNNMLRLNGEKLWKKSRAVKIGDALDLIIEQGNENGTSTVMRVILKSVSGEKTGTEKYKVTLRRWKNLNLTKEDGLK